MRREAAARLAWSLFTVAVAFGAAAVGLLVWNGAVTPEGTFGPPGFIAIYAVVFGFVGALVASRRPENAIGWILLAVGVASGVQEAAGQLGIRGLIVDPGSIPGALWGAWMNEWIWIPITSTVLIFLMVLFPTGRVPSRRWRWVLWLGAVSVAVGSGGAAVSPRLESFARIPSPFPVTVAAAETILSVGMVGYLLSAAGALVSLTQRYRRSAGEERAQMKWIATGAAVTVIALAATFPAQLLGGPSEALAIPVLLGFLSIPIAAGIAILKYRLFDIDVVINRAVLYTLLAAFISGLYVAIVVGVGAVVGRGGGLVLPGVAAAVVALAFQPARQRARRLANRLVYGKRATPYEVLSEFSDRLGETYAVEEVLPRMAQLLRDGTGASRATVWVRVGDELRPSATSPPDGVDELHRVPFDSDAGHLPGDGVPVTHGDEVLGALSVIKVKNDPLTLAEERLLEDLAAQAGLVLRNVRLTEELKANLEELRASRQRIVAAQDEERRRIERNIHDGAQQQLVALAVKLRLVESLSAKDPQKAGAMAAEAKAEMQDALENLRDLARGIYPPLLADQGLGAALSAQGRKAAIPVDVSVDGIGRYPQDVEAAVYFCVLEALQNAAKYSGAEGVRVRVGEDDGALTFTVEDDGRGFDVATTPRGAGLQNIADRLAALGGTLEVRSERGAGTTIEGRVPAQPAVAEAQAASRRSGSNSDFGM